MITLYQKEYISFRGKISEKEVGEILLFIAGRGFKPLKPRKIEEPSPSREEKK